MKRSTLIVGETYKTSRNDTVVVVTLDGWVANHSYRGDMYREASAYDTNVGVACAIRDYGFDQGWRPTVLKPQQIVRTVAADSVLKTLELERMNERRAREMRVADINKALAARLTDVLQRATGSQNTAWSYGGTPTLSTAQLSTLCDLVEQAQGVTCGIAL